MHRTTLRRSAFSLYAWSAVLASGCVLAAAERTTVLVAPGQSIQDLVERFPEGTEFHFEPGLYRGQTVYPRSRQRFFGQENVILSGALELKSWTTVSGFWRSERLPPSLPFHGECRADRPLCTAREDLFFNDRLYFRVEHLNDLGPGTWYRENNRAYLHDDPIGQSVELSATPLAFGGDAEDVVLQDLVIEKYASDSQEGAIFIDNARGWRLVDVIARWNHGAGLSFGPETHVTGGSYSHNGQLGIAGIGENARLEGVEIAYNNYAGYDEIWEAGGTKFWEIDGLVVRDSCIHHNGGPGLWTDNDNIKVLYQGNKVFMNAGDGIKHEISYDAIIRDNIVAHNGTGGFDDWLWGSQILIQNSSNVNVYDNLVEVSDEFGNGIGVINQDRGSGALGPWSTINNRVQGNTVIHLGRQGQNGIVSDTGDDDFWHEAGNRFEQNRYIVADRGGQYWTSRDRDARWNQVGSLGLERNGQFSVARRAAMRLSCRP